MDEVRRARTPRERHADELFGWPAWCGLPVRLSVVVAAWAVMLWVAPTLAPRPLAHDLARSLHLVSLVVALGAIVVVDWHGLLWVLQRRRLTQMLRLAAATGPMVWAGLTGLCLTGPLLEPDLSNPLTRLKMLLVLGAAMNGALLPLTTARLTDVPVETALRDLPRRTRARLVQAVVVSQVCWWGAAAIGAYTSTLRQA